MAELEEAVYAILTSDAGVAALAGDRVYPQEVPQDVALPAVAYARVSTRGAKSHGGPSGLARARVQVNCTAGSYGAAKGLAAAIRQALDGVKTMVVGVWVQGTWLEGEGDAYGETAKLYGVRQDFMLWFGDV